MYFGCFYIDNILKIIIIILSIVARWCKERENSTNTIYYVRWVYKKKFDFSLDQSECTKIVALLFLRKIDCHSIHSLAVNRMSSDCEVHMRKNEIVDCCKGEIIYRQNNKEISCHSSFKYHYHTNTRLSHYYKEMLGFRVLRGFHSHIVKRRKYKDFVLLP